MLHDVALMLPEDAGVIKNQNKYEKKDQAGT